MSTKRQRSDLLRWLTICEATIVNMRDDVDVLLATWSLSAAILYLVYVGTMNDVIGGIAVMVLMRFDLEVFVDAYNEAALQQSDD